MITKAELLSIRAKAKNLKAIVVGDVMLDRYIYGTVDRISPEAPVPILAHLKTEVKVGGAGNVALNLASWGCKTSLVGLVGNDQNAGLLKSLLEKQNIGYKVIVSENRPTTVKTRVVAASHHLLRIDEESSAYLRGAEEETALREILNYVETEKPDLLIIQDYNKGLLTVNLITELIEFCVKQKIFISVDPKEENFFQYRNANLFKPNLREASIAAQKTLQQPDLEGLCNLWSEKLNINTIAITLGSQGIYLHNQDNEYHIKPERAVDVVDVCGAGDAVICSLTLGLIHGLDLEKSGSLANLTGAYVCSHSGVVAINTDEILSWLS